MDRGAWWATVPRVAKSQIQLSEHTHSVNIWGKNILGKEKKGINVEKKIIKKNKI